MVAPSKDAPVIGTADKGAAFKLTGAVGDFWRVRARRAAGVHRQDGGAEGRAQGAGGGRAVGAWRGRCRRRGSTSSRASLLVDSPTFHLQSMANDEHKVADMFVFVSNRQAKIDRRKVFYRSNRKAANQASECVRDGHPAVAGCERRHGRGA